MSLLLLLLFAFHGKGAKACWANKDNEKLGKQIGMRMMNDGNIIGTLWVSLLAVCVQKEY